MNLHEITWRGTKLVNLTKDSDVYQDMLSWALKGDRSAQYTMGVWYEYVDGHPKVALKWYQKAHEQGHEDARIAYKRLSNPRKKSSTTVNEDSLQSGATVAGTVFGNVSNASTLYGEDKFATPRGHGFAAERANHLFDTVTGQDAEIVGDNNAVNGADRIVNGTQIQTKYCSSGSKCVSECFHDGKFRYFNADGSPMQIEVPSDKYDAAVKAMEERIRKGEVSGVSDPAEAKNIIRKGHFTYEQAKNIAKAGTVESIIYDSVNGVVIASSAFGISAALSFATSVWSGDSFDVALKNATYTGLKVGGTTFVTAVLAGQLTKAGLNSALVGSTEAIVRILGPKGSALLVNALRTGKNIYGAAAMKSAAKLLRGNIITNVASVVVLSSADVVNIFRGRISGKQLFKNLSETTASVAGGLAGWTGGGTAGAAAGAAIGSVVPVVGTAIGATVGGVIGSIAGSFTGGAVAGKATNKVLNKFIESDADAMVKIIEAEFHTVATDYLLSKKEAESVADKLKGHLTGGVLKDMYASRNRKGFANKLLIPHVESVVAKRPKITLPSKEALQKSLRIVLEEIADSDDIEPTPTKPAATKSENIFKLTVEDILNLGQAGVAVMGSIVSGQVLINETLTLVHKNGNSLKVTVAGISIGRTTYDKAQAGDDITLLLHGIEAEKVQIGDILRTTY